MIFPASLGGDCMPRGTYEPTVIVDTTNLTEEEWLDYRRKGIGGSDAAIIYGASHFRTGRELYYDKLGIKPMRQDKDDSWVQKKVGHLLEDVVAQLFAEETGFTVVDEKTMFSHPLYPFMLADVDRLYYTPDGKRGIFEAKTTNWQNRDAWADNKIPYAYELQVRHYLAVLNLDEAYIACLWGNNKNDFVYRKITRDYDYEDEIIEMEKNFWEEYVEKGVEPPFVEKPDMALECLKKYLEEADPSIPRITIPATYEDSIEKYLLLKSEKSKLDAEVKRIDSEIKRLSIPIIEEMGPVCEGVLSVPGKKFFITYKTQTRTGINSEQLKKMAINHKAVYDEYVSQSTSRSLKVKELKVS